MVSDINDRFGEVIRPFPHLEMEDYAMENVSAAVCIIVGTVFLVLAILGTWGYFLIMGLCYAVGIMIYEDHDTEDNDGKRRRIR